ncbi:hypothetical protein JTE90_001222 [Oedothorax gibbosus]|uniref:Uncharacterized protein n=1 Tax=Oedothorax gibbosus TaxID=931172 RepID=A0AAV6UVH6_9ARAC|nr:hypothetical protein JTE90_001222 [Oedothorax gibbosus]
MEIPNNLSISDVYCPADFLSSLENFSGHRENADDEIPNTERHRVENKDLVNVSSSWFFELTQENEVFKQRIKDLEQEKEKQERDAAETEVKLSELLDQLVNTEMKLEQETEKCNTFKKDKSVLEVQNEQLMTEMYRHGHKELSSSENEKNTILNKKLLQKTQCIEKLNRKLFTCRNKIAMKNKSVRNMKSHIKEIWELLVEFVNILSNSNQLVPDKKSDVLKKCEEFLSLEILPTKRGVAVYNILSSCSTVSVPSTICNEPSHAAKSPINIPSSSVEPSVNLDKHQIGQENTTSSDQSEAPFANIQMTFSIAPFIEKDQVSNLKEINQPELQWSSFEDIQLGGDLVSVDQISSASESTNTEDLENEKNPSRSAVEKTGGGKPIEHSSPKIIEDSVHSVKKELAEDLYLSEDSSETTVTASENSVHSVKGTLIEDFYLSEDSSDPVNASKTDYAKDNRSELNDNYLDSATAVVKKKPIQGNLFSEIGEEREFVQDNTILPSTTTKNKLTENNTNLSFENRSIQDIEKLPASLVKNKRLVEDNDNLSSNLPKKKKPQLTYDELLYSLMEGDFKQNPSVASSSSKKGGECRENTLLIPVVTFPLETIILTSSENEKCLDSDTLEVEAELKAKRELSNTEMSSPVSNTSTDPVESEDCNVISSIQNSLVSEKDYDSDQNSLHKEITDNCKAAIATETSTINHNLFDNYINESSTDSIIFCKDITVNDGNKITLTDESDNHSNYKEFNSLLKKSPNNLCTVIANKNDDGSVRLGFNLVKSCTLTLDPINYNVSSTFKDPEIPMQNLSNDQFTPTLLSNKLLTIENKKNMSHNDKLSSSSLHELSENSLQSADDFEKNNASSNSIPSGNQDLANRGSTSKESSEDQILASNENSISNPIEMLSDQYSEGYSVVPLNNNVSCSTEMEKPCHKSKSKEKKGSKMKSKEKTKEKSKKKSKEKTNDKTKKKSKEKTNDKSKEKTKEMTKKKSKEKKNKKNSKKNHSKAESLIEIGKNSKNIINKSHDTSDVDDISSKIVKEALKVVDECRLKIFNECSDSDTEVLISFKNTALSSPNEISESSSKSDSNPSFSLTKNTARDSRKQSFSSIGQISEENLNLEVEEMDCNERRLKDPCTVHDPYALFGVALLDENSFVNYTKNAKNDLYHSNHEELDLFQLNSTTAQDDSCLKINEDLSQLQFSLSQLSDRSDLNHISPTPQNSDSLKLKLFNECPKYNKSKQISCKESHVSILDQIKSDFGLIESDCSQGCESSLMGADKTNVLSDSDLSSEHFENIHQTASNAILINNTSDIVCKDDDSSHSNGFLTDDSIFEKSVESIISHSSDTSVQAGEIESVSTFVNAQNNCDKNVPADEIQTNDIGLETSRTPCFSAEDNASSSANEPVIGPASFEDILLNHMKEKNVEETSPTPTNIRDLMKKNPEVSCNDILSVLLKDVQSMKENQNSPSINKQENYEVNTTTLGLDVAVTFEDILNNHIDHVKSLEENQTNSTLGLESANIEEKGNQLTLLNDENVSFSSNNEEISNCKVTSSNLFDSLNEKVTEKIDIEVLPSDNILSQFSCHSTDSIEQNKKLQGSSNFVSCANNCQSQDVKTSEYSNDTDCHIDGTANQDARHDKEVINVLDKKNIKQNPVVYHNLKPLHVTTTLESFSKTGNEDSSDFNTPSLGNDKKVLVESDAIKTTNETSIKAGNCYVLLKKTELLGKDIDNLSKESSVNNIAVIGTKRKLHLYNSNNGQESLCHNDTNMEPYDPTCIENKLNKKENYENVVLPCSVLLERIEIPKQCFESGKRIQPYPKKDLARLNLDNTNKVKKNSELFCDKNKSPYDTEEEEIGSTKQELPVRTSSRKKGFSVKNSSNIARSTATTTVVCTKTRNTNSNKRKVANVNTEIMSKFNLKECSIVLEPLTMSLLLKHSSPSYSFATKTKLSFETNIKQPDSQKRSDGSSKSLDFVKEDKRNKQMNDSVVPDVITKQPLRNNVRDNNSSFNIDSSCLKSKGRTNVFFLNQTSNYGVQTRLSSVKDQITPIISAMKPTSNTNELTTQNFESDEEFFVKDSTCSKPSNSRQGTIPSKRTKRKNGGKSGGAANKRLCSELKPKTVEEFFKEFHLTHLNDKHFKDSVSILKEILINPENYSDITTLLYAVVKYLSLSENNPLLEFAESEDKSVLLPPDEDCIVTAFFKIDSDETPHLRGLLKATVNIIQNLLISKKTISIYGLASLCRIATEICKRQEDKSASLTLCCNLLKTKQEFAPYLIATIVSTWLELFKENAGLSAEEIIFLSSIAYAAKVRTNLTDPDWNASIEILTKYLNSRPVINVRKTINVMMDTIQVSCCDESWIHCHMLTSAVTLFSMHEDYNWIEDNVIKQFVAPLLNKFGTEMIHNKAFEMFCKLYVDLFLMNPSTNPREELLIKFFKKENIKDSSYIQESAALALMKYLFLKNIPLPRLLTHWFEKNHSNPKVIAIRTLFTRKSKCGENKELQKEDFELNIV